MFVGSRNLGINDHETVPTVSDRFYRARGWLRDLRFTVRDGYLARVGEASTIISDVATKVLVDFRYSSLFHSLMFTVPIEYISPLGPMVVLLGHKGCESMLVTGNRC